MITLFVSCPETHQLVRTGVHTHAVPRDDGATHALHCPACSALHQWRTSDAVLALEP